MKSNLLNLFSSLSILLLAAVGQSSAQTPQSDTRPRTASIGGQVTIGGQAAANVTVKIVESDSRAGGEFFGTSRATAMSEPRTFNLVTDAQGRYRLAGLAAGTYKVSAASKTYVLSNQNSDIEPVKWITLDGEAREDVDLSLARGGVITGRVTSPDGRPLIATRVWLYAVLRQVDRTEYRSHSDSLLTRSTSKQFMSHGIHDPPPVGRSPRSSRMASFASPYRDEEASGRSISWRINGRSRGFAFCASSLTALRRRTA